MTPTKGSILLIPAGGLANRIRAIAAALSLAKEFNKHLVILWQKDKGLNANYNSLFLSENLPFKIMEVNKFIFNFYYDIPRKKNFFLPAFFHKFDKRKWLYHTHHNALKMESKDFQNLVINYSDIVIMSGYEFYPYNYKILKTFLSPTKIVIDRIIAIKKGTIPTVAIQIRRTDNRMSIKKSPLHLFEKVIKEEIGKEPNIIIFLATDDETVKHKLKNKYPNNIISNSQKASRKTLEGIIDATAEMFLMAECNIIYGSYFSSFSEVASQLKGKPLVVVKE